MTKNLANTDVAGAMKKEEGTKMVKGTLAKKMFIDKAIAAMGDAYVGEVGGKHYFSFLENGEEVQVAVSLTCPKNPIAKQTVIVPMKNGGMDFENSETVAVAAKPKEIPQEELDNIAKLMAQLGL